MPGSVKCLFPTSSSTARNGTAYTSRRNEPCYMRCGARTPPRSPSGINEFRFPVMTCSGPWYVPCCDAKRACCGKLGGPAAPPALSSNAQIQKRKGKRPQKFSRWVLLSLSLPFRPYSTEPSTSRGGEGPSQKVSSGRARCLFFKVLPLPPLSWLPLRMVFHKFHPKSSKLSRLCPIKFDIPLFKYYSFILEKLANLGADLLGLQKWVLGHRYLPPSWLAISFQK